MCSINVSSLQSRDRPSGSVVEELLKETKDAHKSEAAQKYYEHKQKLDEDKKVLEEIDDPKFKDMLGEATETFVGIVF